MWISETLKCRFKERESQILKVILDSNIDYESIGIFGSYARNEFKSTSDIDMCIIVKNIPPRHIKGYLYEEADMVGVDLIFVTDDYFNNNNSRFAKNLRKDFKMINVK